MIKITKNDRERLEIILKNSQIILDEVKILEDKCNIEINADVKFLLELLIVEINDIPTSHILKP